MGKKWLDTGYLKSKPAEVDHEKGIIRGVKVCSEGEAKGHCVSLDGEFIGTLVEQGGAAKQGLKARFGHPNMCSSALGTFVGRFKNFRRGPTVRDDGSAVDACFADLFLSNSAKETPNGDLYSYILAMAEKEADMFGTSIVFTPGERYRRNDQGEKVYPYNEKGRRNDEFDECGTPDFVECEKLHACDCVDEPAANDGLFSAFANETVAGQITEFLDLHPQVFESIEKNPEILEALAQYGDQMDEFLARYTVYRAAHTPNQEATMADEQLEASESTEEATEETTVAEEQESAEEMASTEETSEEAAPEETKEAEPALESEEAEAELSEAEPSTPTIDPEEFARSVDEFGAEVTAEAFKAGGGYPEAKELHYAALAEENKTLKAQIAKQGSEEGADPAEFGEDQGKKVTMESIISGKK